MADLHAALPALLRRPHGVYSFFNGLASDNLFFHLVTSRVMQVELQRLGLATRYERVALGALEPGTWESITSYWRVPSPAAAALLPNAFRAPPPLPPNLRLAAHTVAPPAPDCRSCGPSPGNFDRHFEVYFLPICTWREEETAAAAAGGEGGGGALRAPP